MSPDYVVALGVRYPTFRCATDVSFHSEIQPKKINIKKDDIEDLL